MATCALCQRSGFLLSIDQNELCASCSSVFNNNYDLLHSYRRQLSYCRQSKDILGFMLSKFQVMQNLHEILSDKDIRSKWEKIIKSDLDAYFSFLKNRGYIQKANPYEILEKELSDAEMKSMLEQVNQQPGENKLESARKILHYFPDILNTFKNQEYYVCSDRGKALAEFHLLSQKSWNYETAKVIFFLVSKRAFLLALQLMVNHAVSQIETPESDMDWKEYDPEVDTSIMNIIYQRDLSKYSLTKEDEVLSRDFTAYSMIFKDEAFEDTIIGPDISLNENFYRSVTDTISFCRAQYEMHRIRSIKKYVRNIQVETANDNYVCPACKAAAEKLYTINSIPDIPITECTSEVGCRCNIHALV